MLPPSIAPPMHTPDAAVAGRCPPHPAGAARGRAIPIDPERGSAGSLVRLGVMAQAGCARALDSLLRQVEGPVYRYLVVRVRAAPDAEDLARDLCQETLIRAVASIPRSTFASDGRLLSWGLTIARNVLLDHLRRARGRAEVRGEEHWGLVAAAGLLPGEELPPPRPLETLAAEVLAEAPESTAELLRLRLVNGWTWNEVAGMLGISESAAKRRYQRAQAAMRRKILARMDGSPVQPRPPPRAAPGGRSAGPTPPGKGEQNRTRDRAPTPISIHHSRGSHMGTELSFSVDVNSIVAAFGSAVEARNDLIAIIENGTSLTLSVADSVTHGNLGSASGTNPVGPADPPAAGSNTITPVTYAVSVDAAGDGSQLNLYITSGSYVWAIIIRTVPNGQNYFQYSYSPTPVTMPFPLSGSVPVTQTTALAAAGNGTQYLANNGTQNFDPSDEMSAPGTQVSITLTNVSPATAQIQFFPA